MGMLLDTLLSCGFNFKGNDGAGPSTNLPALGRMSKFPGDMGETGNTCPKSKKYTKRLTN